MYASMHTLSQVMCGWCGSDPGQWVIRVSGADTAKSIYTSIHSDVVWESCEHHTSTTLGQNL